MTATCGHNAPVVAGVVHGLKRETTSRLLRGAHVTLICASKWLLALESTIGGGARLIEKALWVKPYFAGG